MIRIKAVYRTVHGDIAVAYRPKKSRTLLVRSGKHGYLLCYWWETPTKQKILMPENAWPTGTKFTEEFYMFTTILQKLQALGQAAKGLFIWVITPVLLIVGGIGYLLTKNKSLQTQVDQLKSDKGVIKDEVQDQQATQTAITSLAAYRSLRDQYLAAQKKPSGPADPKKPA